MKGGFIREYEESYILPFRTCDGKQYYYVECMFKPFQGFIYVALHFDIKMFNQLI